MKRNKITNETFKDIAIVLLIFSVFYITINILK